MGDITPDKTDKVQSGAKYAKFKGVLHEITTDKVLVSFARMSVKVGRDGTERTGLSWYN
jgi:hypothetical protein